MQTKMNGKMSVRCSAQPPRHAKVAAASPLKTPNVEPIPGASGYRLRDDPEVRKKLNPQEKLKLKAEPFGELNLNEPANLAKFAANSIDEIDEDKDMKETLEVRLKWLGLFHRRNAAKDTFMCRIRRPNGTISSEQIRVIVDQLAPLGDKGKVDITTRQNLQLRGMRLADAPALLEAMRGAGITTLQSGMDNIRNVVGSPLAGIDPHEVFDTRQLCDEVDSWVTGGGVGNKAISNLPRKFNIAVVGSRDLYEHPHINDLAFVPAKGPAGEEGFNVVVGGFFSATRCDESVPLDAWVPTGGVVPLCDALVKAFRDLGARQQRQKCRVMWLIDELGIEAFRDEVISRLPAGAELQRAQAPSAGPGSDASDGFERRRYYGAHPQAQEGLSYVGLCVPAGRLSVPELGELARLADEYGSGEVRMTVEQSVILPNVPAAKVEALLAEDLVASRLSANPGPLTGPLVACTGSEYCPQAKVETKAQAVALAAELESRLDIPQDVRIHLTGCPNSCAQAQVGDIGLVGGTAKGEDGPVEAADVLVGGRIGAHAHALASLHKKGVKMSEMADELEVVLRESFGATAKVAASKGRKWYKPWSWFR